VSLFDDDPEARNTVDQPDRVTPTRLSDVKVADGTVTAVLPALSWNMIRLRTV
jgi:alpha-N-arabinofuranosidase